MVSLTRRSISVSGAALLAGCATQTQTAEAPPAAPARPPAAIGSFGVDLAARDLNVKPGDDFFRYVNGTWMANNTIPADRVTWGTNDILAEKAERDVRAIIEDAARSGGAPGSNEQKIADFYNAFIDQDAIDRAGIAPIQPMLTAIAALRTHEDVIRFICRDDVGISSPIDLSIQLDEGNPDRYLPYLSHGGIGLPEREYYRRSDGQFPAIRAAYEAKISEVLGLVGQSATVAKARAVVALETQIAERHWPIADRRERDKTYNLRRRADVRALSRRYPWDAQFDASGVANTDECVIAELSAMGPLADLFVATPVSTWKNYITWHYVRSRSAVLPRTIDDSVFDFYGKTLNGQQQQRERWKRGIQSVNNAMGEIVGQVYVQRHFSPEAKAQALELVENMRRAYGERIDAVTWMSPETKRLAREKLAQFRPKIGYPDRWKDYSALEIRAGDAFGNRQRVQVWQAQYEIARIGKPSDREEWFMNPHTVNAYYNPPFNEIVFPAGYLQPPLFDPNADPAVNYGGIGGVIGHEMGHGFDDQGAKSDGRGVLRDWWNAQDVERFQALTSSLATQYDAFEPLPGIHVNGRLTLGENIGDNGGLQVALHAYRLSLNGAEPPLLEGTTGVQRFFLARAQGRRQIIRDQALRNQILSDPHSPNVYRINGVVRNMDAWYEAFNVQEGDALYLPDDQRVEIW
ncbi:M13 family metallopeptidase [Terricaulis sp.]|uniref:M13 family metallopeptidase n=1 Tax=Terricaulis sp. TaxID=2768686 RepID=UPI00378317B1